MTLSEELQWRGFVNQSTFEDITELDKKTWTFYHGFDASADSQTIGNLAAMMFDKVFMRHGHKAILLAGGATSLIGDPGGKDKERELQSEEIIANNVAAAEAQLKKVFGDNEFELVNNIEWTKSMSVLEFLRDIGKHFSMTPLVQRDYIAKRIGENGAGITYTEFSYTLLQGMDFLHLYDKFGCTLQLGGSDQWGNCISGVDLIRRARGKEAHVITLPLVINKATGKKFGKSEEGAVWLDEQRTSVYKFYQFWLNVDDGGVEDYLKVYTELSKEEIDRVITIFKEDPSQRHAQKTLAYEVTKIVHGIEQADAVVLASDLLFGRRSAEEMRPAEVAILAGELPVIEAATGASIIDVVSNAGLAESNGEARRLIDQGAIKLNGEKQTIESVVSSDHAKLQGHGLLQRGKNKFALIKIN